MALTNRTSSISQNFTKPTMGQNLAAGRLDTFKVAAKIHAYDDKEGIFFISKATEADKKNPICYCGLQIEKKFNKCSFCANRCCEPCIKKSRCFPLANEDANKNKPRGPICKTCDRKFLIRDVCYLWRKPIISAELALNSMSEQVDSA